MSNQPNCSGQLIFLGLQYIQHTKINQKHLVTKAMQFDTRAMQFVTCPMHISSLCHLSHATTCMYNTSPAKSVTSPMHHVTRAMHYATTPMHLVTSAFACTKWKRQSCPRDHAITKAMYFV